jgi:hypothetical protein
LVKGFDGIKHKIIMICHYLFKSLFLHKLTNKRSLTKGLCRIIVLRKSKFYFLLHAPYAISCLFPFVVVTTSPSIGKLPNACPARAVHRISTNSPQACDQTCDFESLSSFSFPISNSVRDNQCSITD